MKRKDIGFRELLERVLPLEALPPADRLLVQRALTSGVEAQLESAALLALEQLEGRGVLKRLPAPGNGGGTTLRFQPRDTFELITVHLPAPERADGVRVVPRTMLPSRAPAGLDQVRQLLKLDDPVIGADPRDRSGRAALLERLAQAGRELLGTSHVSFHSAGTAAEGETGSIDPVLAGDAIEHTGALLHAADTAVIPRLAAAGRQRGVRSLVMAAVRDAEGRVLGHLEVAHPQPDAYAPEDLARVALLADFCGAMLVRAVRIEKLVFVDPLTSVYNRTYFDLQAQNELARAQREEGSVALCIVDIDDFKMFNTAYGYEAGNRVLVEVARLMSRALRPFDTVARWGGEEFAVLLTSPVEATDARTISERLRTNIERTVLELEGLDGHTHRVHVTVSIGVAVFPEHAGDVPGLWRAANLALLTAKRATKNQVVFFQPPAAG